VGNKPGLGRPPKAVEYATPESVDRSNHRQPLKPIGSIPPAEDETIF